MKKIVLKYNLLERGLPYYKLDRKDELQNVCSIIEIIEVPFPQSSKFSKKFMLKES